jgi:hypothetical protein
LLAKEFLPAKICAAHLLKFFHIHYFCQNTAIDSGS